MHNLYLRTAYFKSSAEQQEIQWSSNKKPNPKTKPPTSSNLEPAAACFASSVV